MPKLAENAGFGLDKLQSWKKLTGLDMSIRNERDYVLVTFRLKSNVVENVVEKLTDRQYRIMELIRQDNKISAAYIARKLSMTPRSAQRELTKLKELKIIARIGPAKGGHWEIM